MLPPLLPPNGEEYCADIYGRRGAAGWRRRLVYLRTSGGDLQRHAQGSQGRVGASVQQHHRQLLIHCGMDEQSRLVSQSSSAQKRINSTRQEETERSARPTRTVVAPSEAGSLVQSDIIAMLQELNAGKVWPNVVARSSGV
jgi:hypothetical protein